MPIGIVTETYPAPACNLTEQDVEQFMAEMTEYTELFAPAFQRMEQMGWSQAYLRGLLGDAARKNIEQIALGMNKSIIISESIKAHFSSHAALAAIGRKVKKLKVFEPVEQKVKIAQKMVKYSPSEKLLDAFITLLSGAQGMVEVNKRLKADTGLQ